MTDKKNNSIISMEGYKKSQEAKKESLLPGGKPKEDSEKPQAESLQPRDHSKKTAKIIYMSSYLKTKKIPDLKDLKEEPKESVPAETEKEPDNIIILDQYRKEKWERRDWKKQTEIYTKEALSVAGMAFLFLFTFNVALSIKPNSPANTESSSLIAENFQEEGLQEMNESFVETGERPREIAKIKEQKTSDLSHKKWIEKIKRTPRNRVVLGKPMSSDYTGL